MEKTETKMQKTHPLKIQIQGLLEILDKKECNAREQKKHPNKSILDK
jgi:hypothetical protein